jgi:hypothetical protein
MLAILMLPAAAAVYFGAVVVGFELPRFGSWGYQSQRWVPFLFAGAINWAFVAAYWILLWRRTVRWTATRRRLTALVTLGSAAAGLVAGLAIHLIEDEVSGFFGSTVAPIVWLIATTLVWRESNDERAERIAGPGTVFCPSCGYNLSGLHGTRCPECGKEFTLDALLAARSVDADPS